MILYGFALQCYFLVLLFNRMSSWLRETTPSIATEQCGSNPIFPPYASKVDGTKLSDCRYAY